MINHKFEKTKKENVYYCSLCGILSYKGIPGQTILSKQDYRIKTDPLGLRFIPNSIIANYSLDSHKKYLLAKEKGINKIKSLINKYGFRLTIFYKSINLLDKIFLSHDISADFIETIASICVLLAVKFNECFFQPKNGNCNDNSDNLRPQKCNYVDEDNFIDENEYNNNKLKSGSTGLIEEISNSIDNFAYWEIVCLKYLDYDLTSYSAYDYLYLFFRLGIIFSDKKVDIKDKYKKCLNLLEKLIYNIQSCSHTQYVIAMSIIYVIFENKNAFDMNTFKYIYGVDFRKKKYISCINMIKSFFNNHNQINICLDNSSLYYSYYMNKIRMVNVNLIFNNRALYPYLYPCNYYIVSKRFISNININNNQKEEENKQNPNFFFSQSL